MTAPMYTLIIITLVFANLPFITQKGLGFITLKNKHILHHLGELALGFVIVGVLANILEQRSGMAHQQGWEFYVVAICLYLVAAFPAFVWRYFWHGRNRE